ncbi:MAG: XdhC family protein [Ignavibacteria bacterium]
MKELHLWNFILQQLDLNNSIILTTVVHHEKGSPGKEGFKMAVSSAGNVLGSVGGGVMEYNIIKDSKSLLKKNIHINKIGTLHHNNKPASNKSGLICAGSQTNFTISLSGKDIKTVKNILETIRSNIPGKLIFSNKGVSVRKNSNNENTYFYNFKNENDWRYEESIGSKSFVYVIGGGHVGNAVCKIMSVLDFHVTVYDDRKNLQAMKENTFANKKITGSYDNLGKHIKEGNQTYIIIVTTGYQSDKDSLKQVISKNVRYIGLMGTMSKIKKIFNEAVKEGVNKNLLRNVKAPIGIDINSDTPEEIAVSIAAEIIKEKNGR